MEAAHAKRSRTSRTVLPPPQAYRTGRCHYQRQNLYLGKWNTQASRAEYDRLIAEYLTNGRQLQGNVERTVVEVLSAYRKYAESYYRKDGQLTSEYGVIKDALKLVRELYGRTVAYEFGPLALKAV